MQAEAIREAIFEVYEDVGQHGSRSPEGLEVTVGGSLASSLGYAPEELRDLPPGVLEGFVGTAPLSCEIPGHESGWIADLGCGGGLDSWILGKRGHRVLALDASTAMLSRAVEKSASAPFVAVRALLPSLPLESECASWVLMNGVANLVPNRMGLLREIRRVLRPGGRILIADLVALDDVPEELTVLPEAWAWCIGGATSPQGWVEALEAAGLGCPSVQILEEFPPFGRAVVRGVRP